MTPADAKTHDADLTPATSVGSRLLRALVVMLAAAALTSWLQFALVYLRRHVFDVFSWRWWFRDQLMLSAAGYVLLFAMLSVLPIIAHLRWPRRFRFEALMATLFATGVFLALQVVQNIHPIAWLVVAVGLGVQLYRMARKWPTSAWRATWGLAVVGHAATVVTVAVLERNRITREAEGLSALAPAREGAPNILLLILDTVRAESFSIYGAPDLTTPKLAVRAAQGVVFDNAYSTAPWTLPSHTSMFTGRYPSLTSADWMSPLDSVPPTLAEALRDHGYVTGGFTANMNMTGAHTGLARGFLHFEDAPRTIAQTIFSTTVMQPGSVRNGMEVWEERRWLRGAIQTALFPLFLQPLGDLPQNDPRIAADITGDFLKWLPTANGRPFFAFLNLFDAHDPYHPPREYRTLFDTTASAYSRYRGAIRYMDDEIERLLTELDRRGLLKNTIVVISSDHGELFGEHKKYGHGNTLYRPLLHVPLIVLNAPGAVPRVRVQRPVTLRDLAATVLDLAAVPNNFPGVSLRPLLAGDSSTVVTSPVISEVSRAIRNRGNDYLKIDLKSLVDDSSKVIRGSDGSMMSFVYPADTAELVNRADSIAERSAAESRLQGVLSSLGIRWRQ